MANTKKKKEEKTEDKKLSKKEIIEAKIIKDFGDVISPFKKYSERPEVIIPSVLPLDILIDGGIRQGSSIFLSGKPKSGKTTLALHMAAQAQKIGMPVYYYKAEGRLHKSLVRSIEDFDENNLEIIESTESSILSAEKYLNILIDLLYGVKQSFHIVDSLSMMIPQSELDGGMEDSVMMKQGLLFAKFFRKTAPIINPTGSIVVFIAQERAKQKIGHGGSTETASGNAVKFQNDLHLSCAMKERYVDSNGMQYGHKMIARIEKISWSAGFGNSADIPIRYGSGVDSYKAAIETAIQFGLVVQKGAWYSYNDKSIAQGEENLSIYFKENKDVYNELVGNIRTMMFND